MILSGNLILMKISALFLVIVATCFNYAYAGRFIELKKFEDRTLFSSDSFKAFWSIGLATFMDAGANDPLKKFFSKKYSRALYDEEFSRIKRLGFNTLGG